MNKVVAQQGKRHFLYIIADHELGLKGKSLRPQSRLSDRQCILCPAPQLHKLFSDADHQGPLHFLTCVPPASCTNCMLLRMSALLSRRRASGNCEKMSVFSSGAALARAHSRRTTALILVVHCPTTSC